MFDLIIANWFMWINLLIPIGVGVYLVLHNQEYSPTEFAVQLGLTLSLIFLAFFLGYASKDITTKSYLNGKVSEIVYEEEWTELVHYVDMVCSGSGNNQTCIPVPKTREDYHSPKYYLVHDFGSTYISEDKWKKAIGDFGYTQTDIEHSGQISHGDGRTFKSIPNKVVPIVTTDWGINYLYASKSNLAKSFDFEAESNISAFKKELPKYPVLIKGEYGNDNINRVLNAHLHKDSTKINRLLEQYASLNGRIKEVNPMVVLTTSADRRYVDVLKGYFRDSHKNDATLVISLESNGSVRWTEAFGLTKRSEFFVKNRYIGEDTLEKTVVQYLKNVDLYWKRTPMEEYEYLSGEIELSIWYVLMVSILNIIGSYFLFRYFLDRRVF